MPIRVARSAWTAVAFTAFALLAGVGCKSSPAPEAAAPAAAPAAASERLAFDDAVVIDNGHVRLAVSPSMGRIVRFGRASAASEVDRGNLLWVNTRAGYDSPFVSARGQRYHNPGGDKLWPTVQALWERAYGNKEWPPDGVIDGQPWRVVHLSARRVTMESPVSPHLGVQVRRVIELPPDAAEVRITNTINRVKANPFPVHAWTITQVPAPQAALLGVAAERAEGSPPWIPMMGKPEEFERFVELLEGERAVVLRPASGSGQKLGTFGRWVAGVYEDYVFLQSTDYDPAAAYPDGSSVQVYSQPGDYIELELLSRFVHLRPGEALENRVVWRLLDKPATASLQDVQRLIDEALANE